MATAIMTREPANILKPTAEERADFRGPLARLVDDHLESAIDETFLAELDPSWELRPQIDGTGLTPEEYAKIMHRADRVRADYLRDMPKANEGELNRVGTAAAKDALRAVLRNRSEAACCDHHEPAPRTAPARVDTTLDDAALGYEAQGDFRKSTSAFHQALEADFDRVRERTREFEKIPGFRVTTDCNECYFEAGHDLTLERVIESTIGRLAAYPKTFDSERVVWDTGGNVLAVIARREDGQPQAIRLDAPPEYITVSVRDTPEVVEALPASDRNWFWPEEPAEEPQRRLTLPELIALEVRRLRDRGNEAGDLMAGALQELSRVVRVVSAERPDQVAERLSILEGYTEHSLTWEMPEPEMTPAGRLA